MNELNSLVSYFFARMCTNTFLQTHAEKRQLVAMEISISCHRLLYSTFPDMKFSWLFAHFNTMPFRSEWFFLPLRKINTISLLPGLPNCSFNEFLDFYLKATQLNCCVIDRLDTNFLGKAIFPVSLFILKKFIEVGKIIFVYISTVAIMQ